MLGKVRQLNVRLFNPKLVDSCIAGRRPDISLDTSVQSYIKCVKTDANNATAVKILEENMARFAIMPGHEKPYDEIGGSDLPFFTIKTMGQRRFDLERAKMDTDVSGS